MTTREAVIKAVAVLTTAFNRESSETLTEAYLLALSDLSADEVAAAMKRAMVECRFMPVPSELRAFSRPPRDMARDIALAWEAVRRAVDAHDYTKSVDFGPLVNAVVRNLGGWQALCASTVPDLVWRRKDFERVYATFAAADPLTLHGGPLRGAFDGPILVVEIEGQPSRARALPEVSSETREAARDLVRGLADGKSVAKELDMPVRPSGIPPRPSKPKAPPMTAAEVEARKAEIRAQVAARETADEAATAASASSGTTSAGSP